MPVVRRRTLASLGASIAVAMALPTSGQAAGPPNIEQRAAKIGFTVGQFAALDAALTRSHATAAQRRLVESDRRYALGVTVSTSSRNPKPRRLPGSPGKTGSWGNCGQGGRYQVWSWQPYVYGLNAIRQRLWTETHYENWCVNAAHTWVTYVRTPLIKPTITTLGGLAGWKYDGLGFGPYGRSYPWRSGYQYSGFFLETVSNWHQCAVRLGCVQSLTNDFKVWIHADGSGGTAVS